MNYEIIDSRIIRTYINSINHGDLYYKIVGNRLYIRDTYLRYGDSDSNSYEDFVKHIEGDERYFIRYEE